MEIEIGTEFFFPGLTHVCKVVGLKGSNLIRFESDHDWRGKLPIKLVQKHLVKKEGG
jgi:hypothetical protein